MSEKNFRVNLIKIKEGKSFYFVRMERALVVRLSSILLYEKFFVQDGFKNAWCILKALIKYSGGCSPLTQ